MTAAQKEMPLRELKLGSCSQKQQAQLARGVSSFAFPSLFALDAMRFSTDPQLQLIRV